MKNKERKNIAQKIADAEKKIWQAQTPEEKRYWEEQQIKICSTVGSLVEMNAIDEIVQQLLEDEKV